MVFKIIKFIIVGIINGLGDFLKSKKWGQNEEYIKDLKNHSFFEEMNYWVKGDFERGEEFPHSLTQEQRVIVKNIIKARCEEWIEWGNMLIDDDLMFRGKDIRKISVFMELISYQLDRMNNRCIEKYEVPKEVVDVYISKLFKKYFELTKEITAKVALENQLRSKTKFLKELLNVYKMIISTMCDTTIKISTKLFDANTDGLSIRDAKKLINSFGENKLLDK